MTDRTVVVARGVGRLANRLVLFAHLVGAAIEHGFSIVNPAFGLYADGFPATARDLLCRFPAGRRLPASPLARRLLHRATTAVADRLHRRQLAGRDVGLIRLERSQKLDLNGEAFLGVLRRHRVVFVQDWFFRNAQNVERHGDAIRTFFTPGPEVLARAREAVARARQQGDLVVGVHIRRGDYARFKGGRFFYSHARYAAVLAEVARIFPERRVSFLLCSDEPIPLDEFAGHPVFLGPGSALEDLHAFAACDRLVGPPSTYTKWASFYGRVPLARIQPAGSDPLEIESFDVRAGLGRAPAHLEEWSPPSSA